ncbi:MAG: hypothetical protein O3A13_15145 [Proteobacteria bacterium]|nr:hypothetical protein [Pseudomonadota bacterium]
MKFNRKIGLAALAITALFVFFDVNFPLDVVSSYETTIPDPAVESRYVGCYQEKDEAMHKVAFGTVDNPDVQREFISTRREQIARECRELVPEQRMTVREPARFNIVDLKPRFW